MMPYKVVVTEKAKRYLADIFDYIAYQLHSPGAAKDLFEKIIRAIESLDTFPKRFAVLDFEEKFPDEVRRIMVKNYSVFYTVQEEEKTVVVLGVFYSASDFKAKLIDDRNKG